VVFALKKAVTGVGKHSFRLHPKQVPNRGGGRGVLAKAREGDTPSPGEGALSRTDSAMNFRVGNKKKRNKHERVGIKRG